MEKYFALYKGDKFIDLGTAKELAEKYNVTPKTIRYLSTPANRRRIEKTKKDVSNALISVKIDDVEDLWKKYMIDVI